VRGNFWRLPQRSEKLMDSRERNGVAISQVTSSLPTAIYTVPSTSFHQTGAWAEVPT
jgi:hypothetical protein